MWLIRSYMYLALAHIDRAHMFMLADVQDNSWNKFATSGLTSSRTSNYQPKKSWYMVATMSNMLRHTRSAGELSASHGDARIARFKRDSTISAGPRVAFVAWLGSKTGADTSMTIDVSSDVASGDMAVLVKLSGTSTIGIQSSLQVVGGKVTVAISEMPVFILLGSGLKPEPPSGPVPPIDPPVSPDCANLPRGFHCTGKGVYGSEYIICPGGETELCTNGDQCVQSARGIIGCKPSPASPCASKKPGLFCDPSAKTLGWPDPYITCPQMEQLLCPSTAPLCMQVGETVNCTSRSVIELVI